MMDAELNPKVPPLFVIETAARMWGISVGEILGKRRMGDEARRAAIGVVCELRPDLPFSIIGRCFRGRDHSTIIKVHNTAKRQARDQSAFGARYDALREEALAWFPPPKREIVTVKVRETGEAMNG